MTYQEIKTAQSLHNDRIELLNFVYSVLAYATTNNSRALVNMSHRVLDRLQHKTMFIMPDQGVMQSF